MTASEMDMRMTVPSKNPITLLLVLGCLNLFAGTLILVVQVGILIVGKAIGMAHLGLLFGWMLTGCLGTYLLVTAQAISTKRRNAIEAAKRAMGKEHTKELQREAFDFYNESQ